MKYSEKKCPYNESGKATFSSLPKCGIYFIYKNEELLYIGKASDLYKTCYRHFQKWNHSDQYVTTFRDSKKTNGNKYNSFKDYQIQFLYCNFQEMKDLEIVLIKEKKPPHNKKLYGDIITTKKMNKILEKIKQNHI
jgi:excinuclease UvrABC nuclease subunit